MVRQLFEKQMCRIELAHPVFVNRGFCFGGDVQLYSVHYILDKRYHTNMCCAGAVYIFLCFRLSEHPLLTSSLHYCFVVNIFLHHVDLSSEISITVLTMTKESNQRHFLQIQ